VVTTCKTLPVVIAAGRAVIAEMVLLFGLIIDIIKSLD
jgi:hypothetical protein